MRTIEQIEAEMAEVEGLQAPLNRRMNGLIREREKCLSTRWIAANDCRREDVQFSSGDGLPWFGLLEKMAAWMRDNNCKKRFCEWNGRLHFTADVVRGVYRHENPGRAEDLPE